MRLPSRQDGVENHDKVYLPLLSFELAHLRKGVLRELFLRLLIFLNRASKDKSNRPCHRFGSHLQVDE